MRQFFDPIDDATVSNNQMVTWIAGAAIWTAAILAIFLLT